VRCCASAVGLDVCSLVIKMKHVLVAGFLALNILLPCSVLAEEKKDITLTGSIALGQVLQITLLQNPDLQAFSYEVRAREAETLQAGLTYNPNLNVQLENVAGTGNFNGVDQSETTFQLSQRLEMGNKRDLRRSSANLSKEISGWDYKVQSLEVLTRVSQSFTHVLKAQQKIALTVEGVQLAKKFLNAVSERVKAGKVAAIEIIKAQVAFANMRMEEQQARLELETARRKLSVLWGDAEPKFDSAQGDLFLVPDKVLPEIAALSSNPRLSKWSTALAHRQAELDVENSKAVPDLTLSGSYRRLEQTGDNALVFGVTVPLNWFNRNQGGIAKARHRLSKAQEEKRAEALRIQEALLKAHSEVSFSHAKVVSIKKEVLPGAKKALEAISEGYRYGKFGLLDVLDSQKTFFQVKSQYLDALADYHNAVADVKRLTGMGQSAQNIEAGKGDSRP
jgi:cobalt-zinc-cadmium efflux system outer membrane protein